MGAVRGSGARVGGGAAPRGGCEDAFIAAGEDDVPDGGVWMGGRVVTVFED